MPDLRTFTLSARAKLTGETENLLIQIYGLEPSGKFLPPAKLPVLARMPEAMETRQRLEKLFADEQEAGIAATDGYQKLVKEVAFTHLNRLVAFKLMEGRKLMRGAIDRNHDSNGFKVYLAGHDAELQLFEQGSMPQDDFSEGPRDRAYRHFLLWQSGELAKEVRVLFDPENLASRLFPRPRVLREVIDALNTEDMKEAWALGSEATIGWVYQFFIADEKDAAFDRVFKQKQKFQKSDIPAATQVFTPRWIVHFLVENSLGRHWLSMHPDSKLADTLTSLVRLPADPPTPALKSVKEIRVLDPATGTMHFGLVAFDLFVKMYREELANAGKPGWPVQSSITKEADIPAAILANNLFGIDIDLRAVQLAALALYLRAKTTHKGAVLTESNLACADVAVFRGQHLANIAKEMGLPQGITRELLQKFCESVVEASMMGSLVRLETHFQNFAADSLRKAVDDYVVAKAKQGIDESYFGNETTKGLRLLDVLTRQYDVVFTNPPYMYNGNMNPEMSAFMKGNYRKSKGDLYSAFIERCAELLAEGGRLAMITQQSFMFIPTFKDLRLMLLDAAAIEVMAHTGPRAFPEVQGEKVNTTAFVIRRESFQSARQGSIGVYFRLVKKSDAEAKRVAFEAALARRKGGAADPGIYEYRQGDFTAIPATPWVYWITPSLRELFASMDRLEKIAKPWVGLQTSDNPRFLRYWWELGTSLIGRGYQTEAEARSSGKGWFPHMKGGAYRRWYGNQEFIVDWGDGGAAMKAFAEQLKDRVKSPPGNGPLRDFPYYFQEGITWTHTTAKGLNARYMPSGFICNVEGMASYPSRTAGLLEPVLAVLNSSFASYITNQLNPTVHYGATEVGQLPWPKAIQPELLTKISQDVCKAIALSREFDEEDDRAIDFVCPPSWSNGIEGSARRIDLLRLIERGIDDDVFALYALSQGDREAIEEELADPAEALEGTESDGAAENDSDDQTEEAVSLTSEDLTKQWFKYAVGVALGRFCPGIEGALGCGRFSSGTAAKVRQLTDRDGLMVLEEGHPDDLTARIIEVLSAIHGDSATEQIIRGTTGAQATLRQSVEAYLLGAFFKEHVKLYRKRPVYWLLQSPDRHFSAYLFHESATDQTLALLQGKRFLGGRIHTLDNVLQEAKTKEASTVGREKVVWTKRAREIAEILEDLKAFDQHISAASNFPIEEANGDPQTVRWTPEFDDGVLLNAAPLHQLTPSWKRADAKLDLKKAWNDLESGEYDWAKTAMRYWPRRVLKACQKNKSFAIAHGLA